MTEKQEKLAFIDDVAKKLYIKSLCTTSTQGMNPSFLGENAYEKAELLWEERQKYIKTL